MEFTLIH